MMRAIVVADEGRVFASLTSLLCALPRVEIAAYASGRARLDRIVDATAPDVVLVDEMRWCGLALSRIAEARAAGGDAIIIGLAGRPDADWIVDGLRAGADAVVPRELPPDTLWRLLCETSARRQAALVEIA
jgi:DNA-binding NarL/FixJ family response regulator